MKAVVVSLVALSMGGVGAHAQININLGTADNFAVLGASGISNDGKKTYIIGDVGSSPTCTVKGLKDSQVKGALFHKCNNLTVEAQQDLATAYGEAVGTACDVDLSGKNLGGMKLGPGVYCFKSAARLNGILTLDAQGNPNSQWLFQVGSTLSVARRSDVRLILGHAPWKNGERGCGVYWQVGSTATIGTSDNFAGKILAAGDIQVNGGILRGKALTTGGSIKITHNDRVNGPPCAGTD